MNIVHKTFPVLRRRNEDSPIEWVPVLCRREVFHHWDTTGKKLPLVSYRDQHVVFIVDVKTGLTVSAGSHRLDARRRFLDTFADVRPNKLREGLDKDFARIDPGPKPI